MSGEKSEEVSVIVEPACFTQLSIEDVQVGWFHPSALKGDGQPERGTNSGSCPAQRWICYNCGHLGHIAKACRNSKVNDSSVLSLVCAYTSGVLVEPVSVQIKVYGVEIFFVVDTGRPNALTPFPGDLMAANGMGLQVSGVVPVSVPDEVSGSLHKLSLLVARDLSAPALLGRDWLSALWPGWRDHLLANSQVLSMHVVGPTGVANRAEVLVDLKSKYTKAFSVVNNDRPISGFKENINLKVSAIPVFHRAYDVPYDSVQNVKEEFQWANPILVVPKTSGQILLCVDLKTTYPLPREDDIFNKFVGCQVFCLLDLTQLEVEEHCREFLTINTINGLYLFNRLVFGLVSAPAIFQSVIESSQFKIGNVAAYLDNILIGGKDRLECANNLNLVLAKLDAYN
ncbi:hypothetical protein PR048_013670 [Dryococelus australis]|uniref:CCHC-type domain-containing protein n=1 Tax=Dryococelus australis TaxID=614101 RepID=A0ABQ9HTM6_9NEOP|nr:hypothetical protein PR048_013670 [Dryococelus australis]